MKIVHLACVAPPEIGGIGQAAWREVQGLRARGHQAVLIAPSISQVNTDPSIQRLSTWWRFGNASRLRGLKQAIKGADILHLHYPFYGVTEQLLALRDQLPPIVVTFHMDAKAQDWKGKLFDLHRLFLQNQILDLAKTVLVSSKDYATHASINDWMKAHEDRVIELPFGINTNLYQPDPANKQANTVLFVGGLDAAHLFKGLPELLQAFTALPPSIQLRIVGDGDRRASYQAQALQLGISERVHFLGRLDDDSLRQEYQRATVFAFPSTSSAEAFGLVALEAQACGTPVVASTWPGVRTVVKDGETGLLVPPQDVDALAKALRSLLEDPIKCQTMGESARAWAVSRFSESVHLDELERVYKRIKPPTKRIALLTNAYPPEFTGGAATIAKTQVNLLTSAGFEVRVWQSPCTWRTSSVPVRLWKHLCDLRRRKQLIKEITDWHPSHLMTHNLTGCGFATPKNIQSHGIRWLHTLHDVQLFEPSGTLVDASCIRLWQRAWSFLRRLALGQPDLVISPTQWLLDEHLRRGFFQNVRAQIIPNPGPVTTSMARAPKTGEKLRVFFLGLTKEKGSEFIQALATKRSDLTWTIAAHQAKPFTAQEVAAFLPAQHLLLVPSQIQENQPTVILEAASVGLPVIASDVGGIRETLQGQSICLKNVSLDAWQQAIKSLEDPVKWQRQSDGMKELAKRYDQQAYLQALTKHLC